MNTSNNYSPDEITKIRDIRDKWTQTIYNSWEWENYDEIIWWDNKNFYNAKKELEESSEKIASATALIEEQKSVKENALKIMAEINWKPISEQKESINTVPQLEETNLHIKSDSSWKEEMKNWVRTI